MLLRGKTCAGTIPPPSLSLISGLSSLLLPLLPLLPGPERFARQFFAAPTLPNLSDSNKGPTDENPDPYLPHIFPVVKCSVLRLPLARLYFYTYYF